MNKKYEAIAIGVSAGGMEALSAVIPVLPAGFSMAVFIVQHIQETAESFLADFLDEKSAIRVVEAQDKQPIDAGKVYVAPAGYHLLVEDQKTIALSMVPKVNYARPSINVLFDAAADAYGDKLIGVVLTGANSDGAEGLQRIKNRGGLTIVQDPSTAQSSMMPQAALEATKVDHILPLKKIGDFLVSLSGK